MDTDTTAPTPAPSPFETPATAPASTDAPTSAPSPFAAPAQTAAPSATTTADYGDTSFLDSVSSREPLIKGCTVPGVIALIEPKKNAETGKQSVFIAVQLYGDKMVFENGDPVGIGKRLITTIYAPLDTPEKKARSERKLKALLLALNNVVADGKQEVAAYAAWTPQQKLGLLLPDAQHPERRAPEWSFHALLPADKWVGTKVMVQVTSGKDMDGNPRNEFNLLAAATKPTERKAK